MAHKFQEDDRGIPEFTSHALSCVQYNVVLQGALFKVDLRDNFGALLTMSNFSTLGYH